MAERSVPEDHAAAPSFTSVLSLLSGHAVVRAIAVVAELGIADRLVAGPLSARELAQRCDAHEESVFRIMRVLAAVGVFTQTASPVRFGLNPLSNWLRSDVPNSLRDFARIRAGELCWDAWRPLYQAAKTGECAFELAHGAKFFDYLQQHPADARLFNDGMRSLSSQVHEAVIRAYDFSQFRTLTDVGGGSGAFVASLLSSHSGLQATLLDRASAIELSRGVLRARGVAERCRCVAGDFFDAVPTESEAILLSRVLHDFSDQDVTRILRNCRAALPRGGKLLIVEYVVTDDEEGVAAKLFDLHMLAYFGAARERSREEFQSLLEQSGFTLQRIVGTTASISIIEAQTSPTPLIDI
jgi:precorrin-6B methylase 2